MNPALKEAFGIIKPICNSVMVCPTAENITVFSSKIGEVKKEAIQELQQYILFPFITHIKSKEIEKKYELLWRMADAMRAVLECVVVTNFDMCLKIESGLLALVFDSTKPGMIAEVPEELKLSVMQCLTVLQVNLDTPSREKLIRTQVPLIAQVAFVSVHMAKLERMRTLRLASIHCLTAHTATHHKLTNEKYQLVDSKLEATVVDMLSSVLPGVLAALQDVATCGDNPGHSIVVAALNATHRILCMTMHDKLMPKKPALTAGDFAALMIGEREVSAKAKPSKHILKRSSEWYDMAGEKLIVLIKSLISLRTHEHYKVRLELAILCGRMLTECNTSMHQSIPLALDILISLSKDEYQEVSQYCTEVVNTYLNTASDEERNKTMDGVTQNFLDLLNTLPRILNNIDSARKLSALNLLHGYLQLLCDGSRPQRLTDVLTVQSSMQACCHALLTAAAVTPLAALTQCYSRDIDSPTTFQWCRLQHLDNVTSETCLKAACALLAHAECKALVLDCMLVCTQDLDPAAVYVVNWMGASQKSDPDFVCRILDAYLEEDVWSMPTTSTASVRPLDTLDVTVYDPNAWHKEVVPDLYEGTTETRYTDISYAQPRSAPTLITTPAQTLRILTRACLLTEGVGRLALTLGDKYQPYLLRTLCLILERVGSKYEMLHQAGVFALRAIATAMGLAGPKELVKDNADYFTSQVTNRLKKPWDRQSALQILSVVMVYSDASILDCLYGIVEDVLVQSCDKYYENDLHAYLQVFLTFIECIRKWFPQTETPTDKLNIKPEIDLLKDVIDFEKNMQTSEKLLSTEEFEAESGKSAEEMYREDQKWREEEMDYGEEVTEEKPPLPKHIKVTVTVLKRSLNFITSKSRDESILALQILTHGLPILRLYEDELLPLVHLTWAPLVAKFGHQDPVVLRKSLELLVMLADLSKDFIRSRALKDAMPLIYKYLHTMASQSRLKDVGSSYRGGPAFGLQEAALGALPGLVVDLDLGEESLVEAMRSVEVYLSKKQPRPLQTLAVNFFKIMLEHDYGATWHHLRLLCSNDLVLRPPDIEFIKLEPVAGTPFEATNIDYDMNVKVIFDSQSEV